MPSSFSRLAGRKAMNGSGASTAASGIQLWNGIEPALEMAPIIMRTNARAPQPSTDRRCLPAISLMLSEPACEPAMAMPAIRHRSVTPTMMKALVAVFQASGRPMAIMPKSVPSRPSQKKSSATRLSARTAPLVKPTVMRR